jgi:CRISPR/Cas system CSM-associated protein Csm3 (group 7 of RAMP superfamily)
MSSIYYEYVMLKNKAIINLVFDLLEPLHIGERLEGNIKKIVRFNINGKYVPFIPSESIKGTFRNIATKIAKEIFNYIEDADLKEIVKIHDKDTHISSEGVINNYIHIAENWIIENNIISKDKIKELSDYEIVDMYLSFKCPICKLFGSKTLSSKLIFYDSFFAIDSNIFNYTSTSINRKAGVVEEGHLYQIEYMPPSKLNKVIIKIIVDNVIPGFYDAKLLANVLNYVKNSGLCVGGNKSRGYGLLNLNTGMSIIKLMEFVDKPKNLDEVKKNVKILLQKDEVIKKLTLEEYINYLRGK